MKKVLTVCALGALAVSIASCGGAKGDAIQLIYSGTASDKDFNMTLFEDFKEARKAAGDTKTYEIEYVEHGPDKVDSEIVDWSAANSPDVYEAAPDKVAILYGKGALASVKGKYKTYIDEKINDFGQANATFNGEYYGYPYTGDNTYYLQYDKSVFTADDVKTMEGLLAAAEAKGKYIGYNVKEAFWGVGVMFTFGADYTITFDEDGNTRSIAADFNSAKGLKAAKALYNIMKHPAWSNTMEPHTPTNNIAASIAGTWDISAYKKALGDNYGCAVMPTVTIDGETKNLGAFVGGKLLGVNPLRSQTDTERLTAAHELALYLSGTEAQTKRYTSFGWGPCNLDALNSDAIKSDPNMVVLAQQVTFGHEQTSTPAKIWDAAAKLAEGIADGTYTFEGLQDACNVFNTAVTTIN